MVKTQAQFLGHPVGLYVLFFTEMWERFSYYGMRALLVLYMVNYFKWTQAEASSIYKWYTSLVYLTPLAGGYLADRYLGNKRAIIIGAALMALGQFCLVSESLPVFYGALILLIIGNGFFKPNMSTQVGRLYPANDARRDSAYTIFYMGINLGAFFAPLVCGALRQYSKWAYHAGFVAAGVGMLAGLVIYLFFIKWVEEVPADFVTARKPPEAADQPSEAEKKGANSHYMTETEAASTPSASPFLSNIAPTGLLVLALVSFIAAVVLWLLEIVPIDTAVALALGGGFACTMGAWITRQLDMAARDRVLAIFIVAIFVVFFWSAFEQAGNAMNLFADKTTNRYLTTEAPPPSIYPEVAKASAEGAASGGQTLSEKIFQGINPFSGSWFSSGRPFVVLVFALILIWLWTFFPRPGSDLHTKGKAWISAFIIVIGLIPLLIWLPTAEMIKSFFNPVSTESFQSINALAIFLLAPVFAWMWIYLPKRGLNLSIPAKVAIGVAMQAVAFLLMYSSITYENGPSNAQLVALPPGMTTDEDGRVLFRDAPNLTDEKAFEGFSPDVSGMDQRKLARVNGGRIYFDQAAGELKMNGVLADTDRDQMLRATVTKEYLVKMKELAEKSQEAGKGGNKEIEVSVELDPPPGFDLRYAGQRESQLYFDESGGRLVAKVELSDRDYKGLLVAGASPAFRDAVNELFVSSAQYKVSSMWLFWFYILCTLGELCLSPVGLSMVSKLAPAKFATMLMGMWLLTSFFGNFFAGFAGEYYGKVHPASYMLIIAGAVGAGALVCVIVVKKTKSMMHGVN